MNNQILMLDLQSHLQYSQTPSMPEQAIIGLCKNTEFYKKYRDVPYFFKICAIYIDSIASGALKSLGDGIELHLDLFFDPGTISHNQNSLVLAKVIDNKLYLGINMFKIPEVIEDINSRSFGIKSGREGIIPRTIAEAGGIIGAHEAQHQSRYNRELYRNYSYLESKIRSIINLASLNISVMTAINSLPYELDSIRAEARFANKIDSSYFGPAYEELINNLELYWELIKRFKSEDNQF